MKQAFYAPHQTKYYANLSTRKYFYSSYRFGIWLSNLHV